jgi:hypothetical protein
MQVLFLKTSAKRPDSRNRCFMKWFCGVYVLVLIHLPLIATAQTKTISTNQQVWFGYMTSTKLNDSYSVWNDFHYVPEGFFVARTGLTHHAKNTNLTAGYAFLLLPQSTAEPKLKRQEHRPWAQVVFSFPLQRSFSLVHRLRYDARFKQNVVNNELMDGSTFTNRVRFLTALKKMIGSSGDRKWRPYVVFANEVLLNFGESVASTFDQNRIQLSLGLQGKNIQFQVGYMNRFVQTDATRYIHNHTLLFWVTHKLTLKGKHSRHEIKDVTPGD